MAQLDFLKQTLRLDSECDHEIKSIITHFIESAEIETDHYDAA